MTIAVAVALAMMALALGLAAFAAATARKVEAQSPRRGRLIEIDGETLHYVDTGGRGAEIVLIHGLGGNLLHFDYALASRLSTDFRLLLVDRPGAGYSTRGDSADASVNAQAATLAKFIRALKLDKPLVVGHSLGGAVALALALHHPDCVGGLALLAPLTHPLAEVPKVFRGLMIASSSVRKFVGWTFAAPLGMLADANMQKVAFSPESPTPDFATRAGAALTLRPSAFFAISSDAVAIAATPALAENAKLYSSLSIPISILFGRGDLLLDYRTHAEPMKARIPTLELELTDGGHMMPFTAPERCAKLIRGVADKMKAARK